MPVPESASAGSSHQFEPGKDEGQAPLSCTCTECTAPFQSLTAADCVAVSKQLAPDAINGICCNAKLGEHQDFVQYQSGPFRAHESIKPQLTSLCFCFTDNMLHQLL